MKLVTDKKILEQLESDDKSPEMKSPLEQINKLPPPAGALSVLGKSAFRAPFEALSNVMLKLGLTRPEVVQEALSGKRNGKILQDEAYEQGKMAHPIANAIGSILGFGPIGAGTSLGFRAIPGISRAIEAAAPSLLKRTALHGLEGAAIGGLYAPQGEEGKDALFGLLLGGILGGPGKSIVKSLPEFKNRSKNIANIEKLKEERDIAQTAHEQQQDLINAIKSRNKTEGTGLTEPESIARKINEMHEKVNTLMPSSEIPFRQTENLLESPEQFTIKQNAKTATENANNQLLDIQDILNPEQTHDVEYANRLQENVSYIKRNIQRKTYDPVYTYAESQNVAIPRTPNIHEIEEMLREKTYNLHKTNPQQFEELKNSLIKQKTNNDIIPMTDFLGQWKATRNAANKARSLSRKEGEPDQAGWEREAKQLQDSADKQLSVIKNHLPDALFEKLMQGNRMWKEQVIPLYGNKIYEQSKSAIGSKGRGRVDVKNIMHELRGNEPGQQLIRNITLNDPELNRLAIAHKYAKNPEGLLNLNKNEQQYLNAHPVLSKSVNNLRQARLMKNITNRINENKTAIAEESNRKFRQEEIPKQKERASAIEELKKTKNKIKFLEDKLKELKHEYNKGHISKAQFEEKEQEYQKAIKDKKSIVSKLHKVASHSAVALGVTTAIQSLLK